MNRRALTRITKRLASQRTAAKRKGQGAKAAVTKRKLDLIHQLMKP